MAITKLREVFASDDGCRVEAGFHKQPLTCVTQITEYVLSRHFLAACSTAKMWTRSKCLKEASELPGCFHLLTLPVNTSVPLLMLRCIQCSGILEDFRVQLMSCAQ